METSCTDFLFARPSFIGGIASIFDLGGTFVEFNNSPNQALSDFYALRSDWLMVGDSLRKAMTAFRDEHPELD